jgi:hypothetical protein
MKSSLCLRVVLIGSMICGLALVAACQQQERTAAEPADEPTPVVRAEEPVAEPDTPSQPTEVARTEAPSPPPARQPRPAPRPKPVPEPEPIVVRLAAGTLIDVELMDDLSSGTNLPGDTFRSRVVEDVVVNGQVVVPTGTMITGAVEEVASAKNKKIGGRASLLLSFDTINLDTGDVAINAWVTQKGKSETPKDAATIGGAAVLGAIIGHQVSDDDKGTAIGAVVGGAAGTAIAAHTNGKEVGVPAGSIASLELGAPVDVEVRR